MNGQRLAARLRSDTGRGPISQRCGCPVKVEQRSSLSVYLAKISSAFGISQLAKTLCHFSVIRDTPCFASLPYFLPSLLNVFVIEAACSSEIWPFANS